MPSLHALADSTFDSLGLVATCADAASACLAGANSLIAHCAQLSCRKNYCNNNPLPCTAEESTLARDAAEEYGVANCVGFPCISRENPVESGKKKLIEIFRSHDPNDKIGSNGEGKLRFVSGKEPLRYAVFFENLATATAPAQQVVITDQLDSMQMDLSTLSLGPISFGDQVAVPPSGLSDFNTDVDLRPKKNLIVRILTHLDHVTGLVTWRFLSIDPDTGLAPDDPLAGFLPPNVQSPEGQASVLFTVMPKAGLLTGTEIQNQAKVVFDVNPPINTPMWFNTLDNTKPTSQILPLPATQTSASFSVQWAGTDVGAGMQDFTIFVSDNGGPFTPWLSNTMATSDTYPGVAGHTYGFFSQARDLAGNVETLKTQAETTTTVRSGGPPTAKCTDVTVQTDPGLCSAASASVNNGSSDPDGDAITLHPSPAGPYSLGTTAVTLTVTDTESLSASCSANVTVVDKQPPAIACPAPVADCTSPAGAVVSFSPTASDNCPGLQAPICSPTSGSTFALGSTAFSCSIADAAGNPNTCGSTVTVHDTKPPVISAILANPNVLWPPNHKMVPVTVAVSASDLCAPAPTCKIIAVSSNEPVNSTGDGNTTPDWEITGNLTVNLRAERSGTGSGRVYTVHVGCSDVAGNTSTQAVTVTVPHDQGKK
jgi:hypothetical protein